jgi:hypothetical protein
MGRISIALPLVVLLLALGASGCGADTARKAEAATRAAAPHCPSAWLAGWQNLANRIGARVYCPAWMPAPLTGQIKGRVSFGGSGGYTLSVSKDRSYLASFIWAEPQSGEIHVNLRGYPRRTTIPRCVEENYNNGKLLKKPVPCFADPRGVVREHGIVATVFTANQDADLWHILYAWRYRGSLYTVSEHVAEPLTYQKVVANLDRILRNLVPVEPAAR